MSDAARTTNREILLFQDKVVDVRRRAYKRSIGLTLQVNGRIRVSAPKSTPLSSIHAFLAANSEWIETHLQKYRALRESYPPKQFSQGEPFLFLGTPRHLVFERGQGNFWQVGLRGSEICCQVPTPIWDEFDTQVSHPEIAQMITKFYAHAGKSVLNERLKYFSQRMKLAPSSVRFRSQKTRWGSCSARGRVSLNWRLIIAPIEVIDYVIVHELSHLRHYNHSEEFWQLVATQCPNYETLRFWLRHHQYEADFLAKRSELHLRSI